MKAMRAMIEWQWIKGGGPNYERSATPPPTSPIKGEVSLHS